MHRLFRRLVLCMSLMCVAPLLRGQGADIEITRTVGNQTPVAVESSDAGLQSLLNKAFDAHGAYRLAPEDKASFILRFEPAGDNAVRLDIVSGNPPKTTSQTVNGTSKTDAALRAADLAVTMTSGKPGIFAGKIAFIGKRGGATELYVGDLFFQQQRQLTHDNADCVHPTLSPDGRTVLYTSYYRNGFPDIYKVSLADGRRESFLSFSGVNTGAEYSPDGSRVAVVLSGTGNAEIYTVDASARNMKRLTRNRSIESDPSWSPDGQRLVFASDSGRSKPVLFLEPATGGEMHAIPTNISNYCAEPAWNPVHPNLIAFTVAQGSPTQFEIALYDFDTQKSEVITRGPGDAIEACWTRDGRHLIYTERTPNHRRLVLFDTENRTKAYLNDSSWGDASQVDYVYPR